MMSAIENPKITISELNRFEDAIKTNKANADTYKQLDDYLAFLGGPSNYFLNKLMENRINGYDDFIYQRNVFANSSINVLIGVSLGIISLLRKRISGN